MAGSCLPPKLQEWFDEARALKRGRRGRCIANRIDPNPYAAAAAYHSALAAFDAELMEPSEQQLRCRAVYMEELEQCEEQEKVMNAPRRTIDPALRANAIFAYNDSFALLASTCGLLQLPPGSSLCDLHKRDLEGEPPLCPALLAAYCKSRKVPRTWGVLVGRRKLQIKKLKRAPEYAIWIDSYLDFVRSVIRPLIPDTCGIVVQCPPTLRCQLADAVVPNGRRHRDDDYEGHQGEEINFWLPLTRVWGNNSLYVESSPGKADFQPLALDVGQFYRFHGGQCEHFTNANDTGSTRVSLDFRVIPRSLWRDLFGQRVGEYPCVMIP